MSNETSAIQKAEQGRATRRRSGWTYRPDVDVVETCQEIALAADLPGADAESIDVEFEKGILTINAKITLRQQEETKYLLNEYGVGDYHRRFEINQEVDATKIEASFVDGVLTVRLPKPEVVQPRKIAVKND